MFSQKLSIPIPMKVFFFWFYCTPLTIPWKIQFTVTTCERFVFWTSFGSLFEIFNYLPQLHIKEHFEWWEVQLDKMLWNPPKYCKNPTLKRAKRTLNASHIILQMLVWFLYLTTSWPWHAFLLWINIVIISKVFICFYMFRTSAHLCILLLGMVMNSWWKFFWNMELLLQSCPRYTGNHFALVLL